MKANQSAKERFLRDERAVSEVVGYMIALSLSTVILVTSLIAFNAMREHSSDILVDRTVRELAARVATTAEEGLEAGARFPDAQFERTLVLPRDVNGRDYVIELWGKGGPCDPDAGSAVRVYSTMAAPPSCDGPEELDVMGRAHLPLIPRAGVKLLCEHPDTAIEGGTCFVHSAEGRLTIRYGPATVSGNVTHGVYIARE